MTQTAPATFKVKFATSEGDFVVESQREWAPSVSIASTIW
jgi:hypothetical protein